MKRNPIVFVFFLVLVFLAAVYLSYSFLLPLYVEKKVLPSLGDKFSTSLTGRVFTIGLNEVFLGDLIIGDSKNTAVSIASIYSDYTLSSVLNKKIKQVRINGLTLNLKISEGKIIIPGFNLELIAGTENKNSQSSSAIILPVQFDNFQVSNGFLNILYENQRILLPFNLQITRDELTKNDIQPVYRLNLQMFPQGEEVAISGSVDLSSNNGIFSISADSFNLQQFVFLLGDLQKILSLGVASVRGNTEITFMPFQMTAAEIDCELESVKFKKVPVAFGSPAEKAESNKPILLKIKGNGQQWDLTAHGSMASPLSSYIALDGSFLPGDDNAAKGSGSILIKIDDQTVITKPDHLPVIVRGNPEIHGNFSVDISPTGAWQAEVESSTNKEILEISYDQNSLKAKVPSLKIQGKGSVDDTRILVSLALTDIHAISKDASEIISPLAELKASLNQEKKSGQKILTSGEFTFSFPDVKIKRDTLKGKGGIALTGKMKPQPFKDFKSLQATGELVVNNAKADKQESSIYINSIEGRIPWQWSQSDMETTGKIKVTGIRWKNNELGYFEAGLKLKGSAYSLKGRFTHTLLNGLVTSINGQAEIADPGFQASMSIQSDLTPFVSLHLGEIDPSFSNSYMNGELGLDGKFKLDPHGFNGNMSVIMQKGRYNFPEKKYEISNINLSLLIPSLPDLRSAPAQKILFDKASIGDLTFEQGKVIWQLESPGSIFIEEGVVRWAGGRVFTNGVRISPNRKEFVVPIFCDRLILTELLTQFGVTGAEGEGTVSGRIPLLIGEDTIRFEDGFLFSSPGQGGSVKVAALDVLAAGIPKNTPQFAQVDFAAEALKNFQYNWVKLLLNSEGDDLVIKMHMDGKPLQSLPFSYDSQTGLLLRLDDNIQGISQPIRLDVIFRLPLNRFIGYSGKIQDIMKKIQ